MDIEEDKRTNTILTERKVFDKLLQSPWMYKVVHLLDMTKDYCPIRVTNNTEKDKGNPMTLFSSYDFSSTDLRPRSECYRHTGTSSMIYQRGRSFISIITIYHRYMKDSLNYIRLLRDRVWFTNYYIR